MKLSNEMNQNLLYFGNEKKTPNSQVLFLFSFSFRVFAITVINEKQTKILSNYWFFFSIPKIWQILKRFLDIFNEL